MRGLKDVSVPHLRGNVPSGRCEKIGSAASQIAPNARCGWQRIKVSTRCNAGTDETFSRPICAEMFRLEGLKKLDRLLVKSRGTANPGGRFGLSTALQCGD